MIRLTRVCARHVRYEEQDEPLDYLIVSVEDDTGHVGYGEGCDCFGYHWPMVAGSMVRQLALRLACDHADARSWPSTRPAFRGPIASHGMAALANAMLDLVGRRRSQPIFALLGGQARRRPIYASAITLMQGSARSRADQALDWLERGAFGVKLRLGDDLPAELVRLRDLRRSLGDGVMLMADANEKLSPVEAVRTIDVLGELAVAWLEEPVDAVAWPWLAAMRRSTLPIAFGEHVRSLDELDGLVARASFDVLQVDSSISAGIAHTLPLVDAGTRSGLRVVAHNAAGPLAFAANLHLSAVSGAVELLEYPFPVVPFWRALAPGAEFGDVRSGMVEVSDEPGLGVTIDVGVLDAVTVAKDVIDVDLAVDESTVLSGVAS